MIQTAVANTKSHRVRKLCASMWIKCSSEASASSVKESQNGVKLKPQTILIENDGITKK